MRTAEVALWVAVGLAAVAIVAVSFAGWQLVVARRQAQQIRRLAVKVRDLSSETQSHAGQAAEADESARDQARWAWEQVKLASTQLEQAQQENQASAQAEQWEWAYALTMAARELVDTSTELVRIGLDTQVAPHYRQSANRHYRQSCQRWQDTMIKALSRTSPSLEVQHQLIAFGYVHQRLHGHIDVLLRATETGTVSDKDPVAQSVHALRHELATVHRQFQRTVSASLATVGETEIHEGGVPDTETRSIQTHSIQAAPAADPARDATPQNATPHNAAPQTGSSQAGARQNGSHRTTASPHATSQPPAQGTAAPRNGSARSVSDQTAAHRTAGGRPVPGQPVTGGAASDGPGGNGTPGSGTAGSGTKGAGAAGNGTTGAGTATRQITAGEPQRTPEAVPDAGPAPQGPPAKARTPQARTA
ncbi:hypothetical protein FHS23_002186 [Prauserella isguenensis]|uniref:Uncharacterized protein n=1 Tax=Prauserella isguenensis TaxID=1470180 RepID=A0A839S1G9_9PSEU|nr:hypothetical protein [Prauserella isguenensis]MBB3051163.1 hypothetical protein [Prauserella isguenensis]